MELNGSEIVVEVLKEEGVDTVFGYPGGTILNIYDALYKHRDEIHHVLTSHEQGRPMPLTDMPGQPGRWGCASPPPAPVPPIW